MVDTATVTGVLTIVQVVEIVGYAIYWVVRGRKERRKHEKTAADYEAFVGQCRRCYAFAYQALHARRGGGLGAAIVQADSYEDAKSKALAYCVQAFPAQDGWGSHTATGLPLLRPDGEDEEGGGIEVGKWPPRSTDFVQAAKDWQAIGGVVGAKP